MRTRLAPGPVPGRHRAHQGRSGALGRVAAIVAVATFALFAFVAPVAAADPVTWGKPTADSRFGSFIEFRQPATLVGTPERVEILLSTPGSVGPTVIPVEPTAGASELEYRIDLTDGHVVPNTIFEVRWRVVDRDGVMSLGPSIRHTYDDDRADWKTLQGDVVRVHWRDGDQAFGRRALEIGDKAVAATAKLLGVTESEPIDFFIYGDQESFYAALGPATRENVGGQAHPEIRTLFALISPGEIDDSWVESVVPHELTHLVFGTAIDNPYHDPPHWLNEGLAVYLADGYGESDRDQVEQASRSGSIIPLDGLAGAFPTTRERFFLAYAESVSAVDRIVRVNGPDALVKLIRSYADGVSDDEAFQAALGRDVAGFEADWLAELGARPPTRRGPVAAPAGPLPEGWSGPVANPSFEVTGSTPPTTPGAPIPSRPAEDGLARFLVPSASLIGVALIVVIGAVAVRRMRRRTDAAAWEAQGDNRLFGRPAASESDVADPRPSDPAGFRLPGGAPEPPPDAPAGDRGEHGGSRDRALDGPERPAAADEPGAPRAADEPEARPAADAPSSPSADPR
jgi:hypothetical protein